MKIKAANHAFLTKCRLTSDELHDRTIYDLRNGEWNIPALRQLLEGALRCLTQFDDIEVDHQFAGLGRRVMLLNARRLAPEGRRPEMILLAIEDITARRQAERELAESRLTLEPSNRALQVRVFQTHAGKEAAGFGRIAVREGLLSEDEVQECLGEQVREGGQRTLEGILVGLGPT